LATTPRAIAPCAPACSRHERLLERLLQLLAREARDLVGGAAGGKGTTSFTGFEG
jgi:hypothetical protein